MKLINGFKFFLNPVYVTDTFLTTSIFGAIAGIGSIVSGVSGLFGGSSGGGNTAGGAYYDPYKKERKGFFNQLQGLMQNPGSITQDPGYQMMFGQGLEGINRTAAATGQRFAGGSDVARMNYGQGFAHDWYNEKVGQLAGYSGLTNAPMDMSNMNQVNMMQNQMNMKSIGSGLSMFQPQGQAPGTGLSNIFGSFF
jgi:hypothetical protein